MPNAKENSKMPLLSHASSTLRDSSKQIWWELRSVRTAAGFYRDVHVRLAAPAFYVVFFWSSSMCNVVMPLWAMSMHAGASVVGKSMRKRRARTRWRRLAVNQLATIATSFPGCRTRLPVATRKRSRMIFRIYRTRSIDVWMDIYIKEHYEVFL